jgi:hypothetical protein
MNNLHGVPQMQISKEIEREECVDLTGKVNIEYVVNMW